MALVPAGQMKPKGSGQSTRLPSPRSDVPVACWGAVPGRRSTRGCLEGAGICWGAAPRRRSTHGYSEGAGTCWGAVPGRRSTRGCLEDAGTCGSETYALAFLPSSVLAWSWSGLREPPRSPQAPRVADLALSSGGKANCSAGGADLLSFVPVPTWGCADAVAPNSDNCSACRSER